MRILRTALAAFCLLLCLESCRQQARKEATSEVKDQKPTEQQRPADPHSFAQPLHARVKHLDLDLTVDFEKRQLSGKAVWQLEQPQPTGSIIFDTKGLQIERVEDAAGKPLSYRLGAADSILGQPLEISLGPETKAVHIYYRTGNAAEALQWLEPQQTAGKQHPFLFTQSQAILARTWLPCQDSPGIRFTYNATVQVPSALLALMSAQNPTGRNAFGRYRFTQDQPIPAYLMALSVGDIGFAPISERTGVYAEPGVLKEAAYEFGEVEKMVAAAEKLYGKYRWGRYDLLVLPPSFPFGGMENPRLTFATPTILAKDRSLTSLVAHELAHSWSGNLVTNATWNDFWLNEGFTVYFERRIMEALYGPSYAAMLQVLGYQDLQETLEELKDQPQDTRLKLDLKGRNPDDGLTDIAYEKGNFLLVTIEKAVGREAFDQFLNRYFNEHAFGTITTEQFMAYLNEHLLREQEQLARQIRLDEWIYQPGLPANCPVPVSERFAAVDAELQKFTAGTPPASLQTKGWTSHEWLHFIRHLPAQLTPEQMARLDQAFRFTQSGNAELLSAWLMHVVQHQYQPGYAALEDFLVHVGRRKFLTPLYKELLKTPAGTAMAKAIYQKARPNYHAVATSTLDPLLH